MSLQRYITYINNVKTWAIAIAASAGATDANKLVATSSTGRLDSSLMPPGIGPTTVTVLTSEALVAGDYVNIYDNAGTPNARKADSSNGRAATGFVLSAFANAASATVYLSGVNNARTGMVGGSTYYLSTAGGISTTAPSTVGQIIQPLGIAASATAIPFDYDQPITIA